jgi:hypothetical protein
VNVIAPDVGTDATLAVGGAALPAVRPKLHPAQEASTARALTIERRGTGNPRRLVMFVTAAHAIQRWRARAA